MFSGLVVEHLSTGINFQERSAIYTILNTGEVKICTNRERERGREREKERKRERESAKGDKKEIHGERERKEIKKD